MVFKVLVQALISDNLQGFPLGDGCDIPENPTLLVVPLILKVRQARMMGIYQSSW
jgi:hypothetical protein